ncbi:DUF4254 domain-containing protein [Nocardia sp. BMG51109]|uniref:DUF4254 domain-containing protein n=1 Tax=Nocardia sp. BMG51109 TaxID=1056816 RepID=UPI0004AF98E7|nr:DUF4254 domain-containing protein [Nocardia sp. BMG51109]
MSTELWYAELLPTKNLMLAACRGETRPDHVVLRCARELAELHERRLAADRDEIGTIDQRRTEVRAGIDFWIHDRLPTSHGCARVHTEGLGAVVDRLAEFTAHAYAANGRTILWSELARPEFDRWI